VGAGGAGTPTILDGERCSQAKRSAFEHEVVAVNEKAGLDRDALEDLRRYYAGIVRENLDFSHRYLNFYVGLNSALLAAMTAGLLGLEKGDRRGLWLLAGPLLMIAFAGVGWVTVRVFYFRFVEGWVTVANIEKMIGLRDSSVEVAEEMAEPLYKNAWGGFVAQFEDARVLKALRDRAEPSAERAVILRRATYKGSTLRYALVTFLLFVAVAVAFFVGALFQALG
jgi:hypothetical protein